MGSPFSTAKLAAPLFAIQAKTGLKGNIRPPGDKSISHRSLLLNAMAVGHSCVTGLLEGEDVIDMAKALRQLGATIERRGVEASIEWHIDGVGVQGFQEPENILNMGNSGTAARLLAGAIAGCRNFAVMTGDASLRSRPMARVTEPLTMMGAQFWTRSNGRLPMAIRGAANPMPLDFTSPVASAQVKSALLLAGLAAPGETRIVEPVMSRDHTERMLSRMGATIQSGLAIGENGWEVRLVGQPELCAIDVDVPADISSAAFPMVATLITPDSEVRLNHIGLNPARAGLVTTLQEMGGDIEVVNTRDVGGEPVGDILVRTSSLKGIDVPAARAASMIDEYPILAIAAAAAEGQTRMRGIGELRVKESDRIALMAEGLASAGVKVTESDDELLVTGSSHIQGDCTVSTALDHRIAMSFLILGLISKHPITIDDSSPISTSFPSFQALMASLGAEFGKPKQ